MHTFELMLKYPSQIAVNTLVQRVLGLLQVSIACIEGHLHSLRETFAGERTRG